MQNKKIFYAGFILSFSILFQLSAQQKADIEFEDELDIGKQEEKESEKNKKGLNQEIIVEGTDEYLFYSSKEKVSPEISEPPLVEKWQEKTDKILNGKKQISKIERQGNIYFSYGNRNFFLFDINFTGKVKETVFAVNFHHHGFSHIDLEQKKNNSEQMNTDLDFFSESHLSPKYHLLFSLQGINRYNRLQNTRIYNHLDKRFLQTSLLQKFFITPNSQIFLDLRVKYLQGFLQKKQKENFQSHLADFTFELGWKKNLENNHEINLSALIADLYRQEYFSEKENNLYSFFLLKVFLKLWNKTLKTGLPSSGTLTLNTGAGNYLKDYQVLSSLLFESKFSIWTSSFYLGFEKKYNVLKKERIYYRYLAKDSSKGYQEKLKSFWKNQIWATEKIALKQEVHFSYFFTGKQLGYQQDQEVWQYQIGKKYYLLGNQLGILFQITPNFAWDFSLIYNYSKNSLPQKSPLQFETALTGNFEKVLFSIQYRFLDKRYDDFSKEKLKAVHLLDSSFTFKLNRQFSLVLSGENLLLQKYFWLAPFQEPELTVHLGLKVVL